MTEEEIKSFLCYYDLRNPYGIACETSEDEFKELLAEGYGNYRNRYECYCDNCHFGRTDLAEELLRYIIDLAKRR